MTAPASAAAPRTRTRDGAEEARAPDYLLKKPDAGLPPPFLICWLSSRMRSLSTLIFCWDSSRTRLISDWAFSTLERHSSMVSLSSVRLERRSAISFSKAWICSSFSASFMR